MPNWCHNVLILRHKNKKKLLSAVKAFAENRFLNYIAPQTEDRDLQNWNRVKMSSWGVKWEVDAWKCGAVEFHDDRDVKSWNSERVQSHAGADIPDKAKSHVTLRFITAWNPPIRALEYACVQGFEYELYYFEGGRGFAGVESSNGEISDFVGSDRLGELDKINPTLARLFDGWGAEVQVPKLYLVD